MKKSVQFLSFVLFFFCLPFASVYAAGGDVSADVLIIRAKPAAYFERIGQLSKGDKVKIISEKDDWLEIDLPDGKIVSWVPENNIDNSGVVLAELTDLHAGPGKVFTAFYRVRKGQSLTIIDTPVKDHWRAVYAPDNATGWVSSGFVQKTEEDIAATTERVVSIPKAVPDVKMSEEFIAKRTAVKEEHALQLGKLSEENQKLAKLKSEADQLQQNAEQDKKELAELQAKSARYQALKTEAEAKVTLAKSEREKADLAFQQEQERLLRQKAEAEFKAKNVAAEREKWENEAKKTAAELKEAQMKAKQQTEMAKNEAELLSDAEKEAVIQAEKALKNTIDAEKKQKETELKQKEITRIINQIQQEVDMATKKVEILRLEREKMTASAKEENAKILLMKAEAERAQLEKQSLALKIEQYKKENQDLNEEAKKQKLLAFEAQKIVEAKETEIAAISKKQKELDSKIKNSEKTTMPEKVDVAEKKTAEASIIKVTPKPEKAEQATIAEQAPIAVIAKKEDASAKPEALKAPEPKEEKVAAVKTPVEIKKESPKQQPLKNRVVLKQREKKVAAEKTSTENQSLSQTDTEQPTFVPADPKEAVKPKAETWDGFVISLGAKSSRYATHALCIREKNSLIPICYLRSSHIQLQDWVHSNVKVTGKAYRIKNWSRPVIDVTGIIKEK